MPLKSNGHISKERNIILCMHWQDGNWSITSPELPAMMIISDSLRGALEQFNQHVENCFGVYENAQ